MFAVKNRICDPPNPPDRRSSPRIESKINSGASYLPIRHKSVKNLVNRYSVTNIDRLYLYAFDKHSPPYHRTKPTQRIIKSGDG